MLGVLTVFLLLGTDHAHALQPISISPDQERVEITGLGEFYEGRGDNLQVETAAGLDGMSGRMSVRAVTPGTSPGWIVFALRNATDKPVERWVTAERYTITGSGVVWPDLDGRRIEALTPSLGFVPERVKSDRADIFRVTLEPGQTITYVAELSSERFARIYLWKPIEYELKARDRQLFNGINLGLVGLLAIFLTAVFAANHKVIFPATALVAWCVLGYLCVDFGFFHKLFQLRPEDNAVYRAATEAAMAASLVIFLHAFLRLGLWHGFIRVLVSAWIIAQLALIAVAVIDPRLASTFARASFALIGGVGLVFTLFLALRGQDRALSLVPTWLLFLVWIFGAGVVVTGRLAGDVVVSGLVAGLVLIVVLLGFTVTQFAFRALEPLYGASPSDLQIRSLAVDAAGAAIWEWNTRRDELKISPHVEAMLGLAAGTLSTRVDEFIKHMHPADRERFRLMLWSVQERNGGSIRVDVRMRHTDNSYRWFEIEAASLPANDRRALRCVGLMRDVTDNKRSHERLLHDAVYDSLTGLPNRQLLLDRLAVVSQRVGTDPSVRPTVMLIDIDKFKGVNASLGLIVGDSLLLTVARRLARHLGPQDTLARIGGDQFAFLITNEQEPRELAGLAERIRRSLRSPIKISNQEIVLTGSLGLAVYEGAERSAHDLLKCAEIAMYRAKRGGNDRIEIYRPEMEGDRAEHIAIEADLKRAIEKAQVRVLYQPIIYLPTEELAGFEAVLRWEHPKLGSTDPSTLQPMEADSDVVLKLGSYALARAAHDVARWQKELPRPDTPLFVSVNVASRQLFRQDLIQEIRHIFGRALVPKGALKLEVSEALIMENPEQAAEILEWLRGAGAELSLDDFGTGYSSVAYLQRFAFDTVKLDSGIVQSAGEGGAGSQLLRSIVALAHELGKKVVAEGVETPEDIGLLRSINCEYAQGVYYGAPMSEREVLQLLRAVRKSERKLQRRGFMRGEAKDKQRKGRRGRAQPEGTPPPVAPEGMEVPAAALANGESGVPPTGAVASSAPRTARPGRVNGRRPRSGPPPLAAANGHAPPYAPAPEGMTDGHDVPLAVPPPMPAMANGGGHEAMETSHQLPVTQPPPMPPAEGTWGQASESAELLPGSALPGVTSSLAEALAPHEPQPSPANGSTHANDHAGEAAGWPGQEAGPQGGMPGHEPQPLPPLSAALPEAPPPAPAPMPELPQLKTLPPAIAASLAKLAGMKTPPPRVGPVGATTAQPPRPRVAANGDER